MRLPKDIDKYSTAAQAAADLRKLATLMEGLGGLVSWETDVKYLALGTAFVVDKGDGEIGLHDLKPTSKFTGNIPAWGKWRLMSGPKQDM
jgi:hypothetical protein